MWVDRGKEKTKNLSPDSPNKKAPTIVIDPIALDNLLIALFVRDSRLFGFIVWSTFDCWVLHAVLKLLEAEPFTVDRDTKIAQIYRVLGRIYILCVLREQYGALVVVVDVLVLLRHLRCARRAVVVTAHRSLKRTRARSFWTVERLFRLTSWFIFYQIIDFSSLLRSSFDFFSIFRRNFS